MVRVTTVHQGLTDNILMASTTVYHSTTVAMTIDRWAPAVSVRSAITVPQAATILYHAPIQHTLVSKVLELV